VSLSGWSAMQLQEPRNTPLTKTEVWLTRKEAASYLKLGESTLAKLFVSGDGPPAIKIGRSVRYSSIDLNDWMNGRRRRSSSDAGCR
jgi:excisionase family DNA binding protein